MPDNNSFKLGELASPTTVGNTSTRTGNVLSDQIRGTLTGGRRKKPSRNNEFMDILGGVSKDTGDRPKRSNEGVSFGKSFEAGVEGLKGTGHGALAAVGSALGFQEFAESEIEAVKSNQRKADRLVSGLLTNVDDIEFEKGAVEGISDLSKYLINGAGSISPSMLEVVASVVAGTAVGSTVGPAGSIAGGLVAGGARVLGKKKLASLFKDYVVSNGFKRVAGQSAKRIALNKKKKAIVDGSISKFYGTVSGLANGYGLGTGEVFNTVKEAGGSTEEASTAGLILGLPFAALDVLLPASIIKNIGKKAFKGRIGQAGLTASKGFLLEGTTETAQEELLLRTQKSFDDDFDLSGKEANNRRLNSFILGGFAGGVMSGAGGLLQPQVDSKDLTTPITNVDFTNKEVRAGYSRLQTFKNTNDRFTSMLDSEKDQETVRRILDKSDKDISDLRKSLSDKFLSEENTDTASKAEAREVIQVIDLHVENQDKLRKEAEQLKVDNDKIETAQKKKADLLDINPEYKHIDGIQNSVLGIAESIDIKLNKGQLESLSKTVQDRMFKFQDQSMSAEELIDNLTPLIEQDIHEIDRARTDDSAFEQVAKNQRRARGAVEDKRNQNEQAEQVAEDIGGEEGGQLVTQEDLLDTPIEGELITQEDLLDTPIEGELITQTDQQEADQFNEDLGNSARARRAARQEREQNPIIQNANRNNAERDAEEQRIRDANDTSVINNPTEGRISSDASSFTTPTEDAIADIKEAFDNSNESFQTADGRILSREEFEAEDDAFTGAVSNVELERVGGDIDKLSTQIKGLEAKKKEIEDAYIFSEAGDKFADVVQEVVREVNQEATVQLVDQRPVDSGTITTINDMSTASLKLFSKTLRKLVSEDQDTQLRNKYGLDRLEAIAIRKQVNSLLKGVNKLTTDAKAPAVTKEAQERSTKSSDSVKDQLRAIVAEKTAPVILESDSASDILNKIESLTPAELKKAQEDSIIAATSTLETPKDTLAKTQAKVTPKTSGITPNPKIPEDIPVKRASKTVKDVDVGSIGTVNVSNFGTIGSGRGGSKKGLVNFAQGRVIKEGEVAVTVVQVLGRGVIKVRTGLIGGNPFEFKMYSNRLVTEKNRPTLDDQNANQVSLENKVAENRNSNVKPNSKVIQRTKAKPVKESDKATGLRNLQSKSEVLARIEEDRADAFTKEERLLRKEADALSFKMLKGKATDADLARALAIETQLDHDQEAALNVDKAINEGNKSVPVAPKTKGAEATSTKEELLDREISDDDISNEKILEAVDKANAKRNKAAKSKGLTEEEIAHVAALQEQIDSLTEDKKLAKADGDLEGAREIQVDITALAKTKNDILGIDVAENNKKSQIAQKMRNANAKVEDGDGEVNTLNLESTVNETLGGKAITLNSPIITIQGKTFKVLPKPMPDNAERKGIFDMIDRVRLGLRQQRETTDDFGRTIIDDTAVRIEAVNSFKEYEDIMHDFGADPDHIYDEPTFNDIRGVAVPNARGGRLVILNLSNHQMHIPEIAGQTLMHELVGHVGLARIFGDKLKDFTFALLQSNPALRNDILGLSKRWRVYVDNYAKDHPKVKLTDKNSFTFKEPSTGEVLRIHKVVAYRLGEEYLAELAAIKMSDKTFKVSAHIREGFLKKMFRRLVHLSRTLFGKFGSGINESDMLAAVAASADFLFNDADTFFFGDMRPEILNHYMRERSTGIGLTPNGRLYATQNGGHGIEVTVPEAKLSSLSEIDQATLDVIELVDLNHELTSEERLFLDRMDETQLSMETSADLDGRRAAEAMGANKAMTDGVVRAQHDRYGKLNESSKVKWLNDIGRAIRNNPIGQKFFALGNLPYVEIYNGVQAITKGKLGKMERLSKRVNKQLGKLSAFQKEQVYKFFTNRYSEAQTNSELGILGSHGVPKDTLSTILEAKETIESIGQQLVDLNMLNPKSFEENRGSYLPRRYLKYLFSNPGGGKKVSLLSFLQKDSNLDEDTRALLGEIKDPAFLVAETIGMIGRDTAILQMFDSLAENGRTGATSWVLNSEDFTTFKGKGVTQAWLAEEVDRVEQILGDSRKDSTGAFQLTPDQLAFNEGILRDLQKSQTTGEQAILKRMEQEAKENGQENLSPAEYQSKHYKQMKTGKRMGKLSGLWVRKEIHADLEGVLQSFELDDSDTLTKFFGNRGLLTKMNTHWKMLKVPFNLPSWFRNSVGNMTLLDISTTTNSVKLTKMFTDEVYSAAGKNESKYWKMAEDHGLFGTTYAAAELYGMRSKMDRSLKMSKKTDAITDKSKLMGMFSFMKSGYLGLAEIASDKFGLLEGTFKTVAMRDFIEQWQTQNGVPNIDSLSSDQRQAVILEAVAHANNALFDYSQVPQAVNVLRRYPLGAPFITFMYKSFPVVIESLTKRPQKFIKYAAFPMLMSMLAQGMNDWDDKDIERLEASLPQWTRDRSSVFLVPIKDSQDRPQFADYSYALPWSPFVDALLKISNHFESNNISSATQSVGAIGLDLVDDFGFLGGPTSTLITAFKSNKDGFTGKTIVNEGDNPSKKMADLLKWTWNMAAPSFLTSHGFLGKTLDNLGIDLPGISEEPLDSFGKQKLTAGQVAGNLTGFGTRGFDPKDSVQSNLKGYARRLIELNKSRSKFIKDHNIKRGNPQERAAGLREFNDRRKLLVQERADFLDKVR